MIDVMNTSSHNMSINFNSSKSLAIFLATFIPMSTALFTVHDLGNEKYRLDFNGGY